VSNILAQMDLNLHSVLNIGVRINEYVILIPYFKKSLNIIFIKKINMSALTTLVNTNPWKQAYPKCGQVVVPLCKHIYDTLELSDGITAVGVVPAQHRIHSPFTYAVKVILKKEKEFSFTIEIQPAETGERVLKANMVLAQLIMNDTLLLRGVSWFNWSVKDGEYSGEIIFHGHKVDISPFFDGETLETWKIVNEIIRKVSASSGDHYVCSIGMVPINGNVSFLECEDTCEGHRFYEETNIRKWVSEQGTSPFTRIPVSMSDIQIHGPASISMDAAPRMMKTRKSDVILKESTKKSRTIEPKNIVCVWDRSGSMCNMAQAAEDGLRKTIEEHQSIAVSTDNPTKLWVISFDNEIETHISGEDITTVCLDKLSDWVIPRGTTKLYDALYAATVKMRSMVGHTIFIAMTDGHDTCSEVSADTVRIALEKLKSESSLECIFMAANIGDAQVVGPSMGFDADTSIQFTSSAAPQAFRAVTQSSLRSVSGGSAAFTGTERQSSMVYFNTEPRTIRRSTVL